MYFTVIFIVMNHQKPRLSQTKPCKYLFLITLCNNFIVKKVMFIVTSKLMWGSNLDYVSFFYMKTHVLGNTKEANVNKGNGRLLWRLWRSSGWTRGHH